MKILLKKVRLSFPSLFHKASFNGEETKFEGTFLIDKEEQADKVEEIQNAIKAMIKSELKGAKLGADKICLKDGDDIGYEGYDGCYSIKASNKTKPHTLNKDKSQLTEDDNVLYSGCYVNASIELWAQNNAYGKRINATLNGVQFAADGEPLGGGRSAASIDDFDDISDDDEDPFA